MLLVPPELLPYTLYREDAQIFDIPPLNKLLQYKVIVTTAISCKFLFLRSLFHTYIYPHTDTDTDTDA
jgi:hypothetical protein